MNHQTLLNNAIIEKEILAMWNIYDFDNEYSTGSARRCLRNTELLFLQ